MDSETITPIINSSTNFLTYLSQKITEIIYNLSFSLGLNTTPRWASTFTVVLALGTLYLGIKLSKPILRVILIVLSIFLILGLIIPW